MGSIRCDVSILSFSDLFIHLLDCGKSGLLTVAQGQERKSFYISGEGVALVSTTRAAASLGEVLLRTGKVSRGEFDRLMDERDATGKRMADLVLRYGLVSIEDMDAAKRSQVEEELHELFTWERAVCEFVEGPPPRVLDRFYAGVFVGKAATALMLESARRSDELARLMSDLGDEELIPLRVKPWMGRSLDGVSTDVLYSVYLGINGRSSVAEVVRRSLYPRLEALRALRAFLADKLISLVSPNQATEMYLKEGTVQVGDFSVPEAAAFPGPAAAVPKGPVRTILLLGEMLLYKDPLARFLRDSGYAVQSPPPDASAGSVSRSHRISLVMIEFGARGINRSPLVGLPWEETGPRIVAIARDVSPASKRMAFEQGANAYMVIPFTRMDILSILNAMLASATDKLPFYTHDLS